MSDQTDPRIQQILDEIKTRFEKRIEEIKQEGSGRIDEIKDDAPDPNNIEGSINMTFDVKFKTVTIKFDIPKFSMELHKIIFDVPSVTMDTKTLSWDEPATKMETECVTKKPVVTSRGGSIKWKNGRPQVTAPRVTTEWVCVYADIPKVYMKRREIKIDMPEFSMKKQEISFDKPIIKFETVEIKFDLPQFHLRDLSGDLREQEDELKDVGRDMENDISEATREMNDSLTNEINDQVAIIFDEIRKQLLSEREKVSGYYDDAITKMKTTIKILKENNALTEIERLESDLSKLVEDYKKVLTEIDSTIDQLNKEQNEVISGIKLT